jgi:hypothetical protein
MKLVTEDLPPFEVLFLRGVAASLACAMLVALRGEWRAIAGALNRRALLRAAAETLSVLCYIVALARMQIADAIAILQAAPLIRDSWCGSSPPREDRSCEHRRCASRLCGRPDGGPAGG